MEHGDRHEYLSDKLVILYVYNHRSLAVEKVAGGSLRWSGLAVSVTLTYTV